MKPTLQGTEDLDIQLFELAPVSLWVQDLSALKARLEEWREAGMTDLRSWLRDPGHLLSCQTAIRIVRVNRHTLATYEARDEAELFAHIPAIFNDPSAAALVEVLCQLWAGATQARLVTQNRTVGGRVIDVSYAGRMMPGHEDSWARYLISVEDITQRVGNLFQHSPVPMLIRDESWLAAELSALRAAGIHDLAAHMQAHPSWVDEAQASRRIIDGNRPALTLFGASDREALIRHLKDGLSHSPRQLFLEDLADLWRGNEPRGRDITTNSLVGRELHLKVQYSPVPVSPGEPRLVQIALTDIGDNKRSEAHFERLSLTDPLTGLLNRAGYAAEFARLEAEEIVPTSIIVADLNELKAINDGLGHDAGDEAIRSFGAILKRQILALGRSARVGGDEFVILLPGTDRDVASIVMRRILEETGVAGRFGPHAISVSLGLAIWRGEEPLQAAVSRADARMYDAKRGHRLSQKNRESARYVRLESRG